MFIYFSPVWKYCMVTRERINTGFLYRAWCYWSFGSPLGGETKKKCIWDFCLQWFQFYRDGFGWLAQGERSLGSGRFLENKGRLTFTTRKWSERGGGMREFLFVCPGENLRSLFSPFISHPSSHLPLHHPSSHFAFLFSSHYLTELLFPPPWKKTFPLTCGI